jgi:lauroyl/myristoyl acyltransferase
VKAALENTFDLRMGGRWTRTQRLKNAGIRALVVAALAIADRLPKTWLLALGAALGALVWALCPGLRRTAKANLELCLPALDASAMARACFRSAGRNLAAVSSALLSIRA